MRDQYQKMTLPNEWMIMKERKKDKYVRIVASADPYN